MRPRRLTRSEARRLRVPTVTAGHYEHPARDISASPYSLRRTGCMGQRRAPLRTRRSSVLFTTGLLLPERPWQGSRVISNIGRATRLLVGFVAGAAVDGGRETRAGIGVTRDSTLGGGHQFGRLLFPARFVTT